MMKILLIALLSCALLLSACAAPTPASQPQPPATDNPISPAMQTAMAKSTQLAQATLDPKLFPSPTPPLTATPSAAWRLAWSEEFDGPDGAPPDSKTWSYDVGGHGW